MPKQKTKEALPREMQVSMVGFNHRAVAEERRRISAACPLVVTLEREPLNIHDPNAIKVICQDSRWEGMHIGYLPRGLAGVFASRMDSFEIEFVSVCLLEVDPDAGMGELLLKTRKQKSVKG